VKVEGLLEVEGVRGDIALLGDDVEIIAAGEDVWVVEVDG
jgi:hypothetical protein